MWEGWCTERRNAINLTKVLGREASHDNGRQSRRGNAKQLAAPAAWKLKRNIHPNGTDVQSVGKEKDGKNVSFRGIFIRWPCSIVWGASPIKAHQCPQKYAPVEKERAQPTIKISNLWQQKCRNHWTFLFPSLKTFATFLETWFLFLAPNPPYFPYLVVKMSDFL